MFPGSNEQANNKSVCIVFASESGHTKMYAEQAAVALGRGSSVRVVDAASLPASSTAAAAVTAADALVLMTSTFGSGDPPQVRTYIFNDGCDLFACRLACVSGIVSTIPKP